MPRYTGEERRHKILDAIKEAKRKPDAGLLIELISDISTDEDVVEIICVYQDALEEL
jgi:hypothetical protein